MSDLKISEIDRHLIEERRFYKSSNDGYYRLYNKGGGYEYLHRDYFKSEKR